jgi:hypothetical protein
MMGEQYDMLKTWDNMTRMSCEEKMMDTRTPCVFITAYSHSGSTLLAFLLGAHPEIATVGEMTGLIPVEDPDVYLCSCGQKIKECEFWRAIASVMQTKGFQFEVANFNTRFELGSHPLIRRLRTGSLRSNALEAIRDAIFWAWPGQTRQLRKIAARNKALVEAVLDVTGKRVFLDSSKEHMRIKYLLKYSDLDMFVIHLVRDVRGVVTDHLSSSRSAQQLAQSWVNRNRNILRQLEALPDNRQIRIHYEDLCQDMQGTLECLYRFCGVEPGVVVTDFRSAPHHIVGNKMRLGSSSEIKLDERWKKVLTEDLSKTVWPEDTCCFLIGEE